MKKVIGITTAALIAFTLIIFSNSWADENVEIKTEPSQVVNNSGPNFVDENGNNRCDHLENGTREGRKFKNRNTNANGNEVNGAGKGRFHNNRFQNNSLHRNCRAFNSNSKGQGRGQRLNDSNVRSRNFIDENNNNKCDHLENK